jgi:Fe2+ transport system protein FeoA
MLYCTARKFVAYQKRESSVLAPWHHHPEFGDDVPVTSGFKIVGQAFQPDFAAHNVRLESLTYLSQIVELFCSVCLTGRAVSLKYIEIQSQQLKSQTDTPKDGNGVMHDILLPLECLNGGDWAEVAEVMGEPRWVGRLAEMGIRSGCRLCMLQPGSPCLLQIGGCRLSLRGDCATRILVRPVACAC